MIKGVEESDDGTYTCRAVVIQTGELAERNIKLEVSEQHKTSNVSKVISKKTPTILLNIVWYLF